jgi:phosphatidylserine/phosphatidylglycerophosphate/cardiolipin synthase-like enzyme
MNKRSPAMSRLPVVIVLLAVGLLPGCQWAVEEPRPLPPIEVYFSPNGGCTDAIVKAVHDAQSSILVQAYSFTSSPIAKARVSAHNKIIIIDGETVVTGSFNFTKSAEQSNAENLLIIRDKALAETYTNNWNKHAEHSEVYEGRQEKPAKASPPAEEEPQSKAGWEDYDGFVASVNSEVFHRPDCKGAKKIAVTNLLRYESREQAVKDGKRPCGECKP